MKHKYLTAAHMIILALAVLLAGAGSTFAQSGPFGTNLVIEKDAANFPPDHWYLLGQINFAGQPEEPPTNFVLDNELNVVYFTTKPFDISDRKTGATFDFNYHPHLGIFSHYAWQMGPGHNGWYDLYDENFDFIDRLSIVGREETRPHGIVAIPTEYTSGNAQFLILGQDWVEAGTFRPEVSYPYTPPGTDDTISANTLVEVAYLQHVTISNLLINEYNLAQYVSYDDVDWDQYSGKVSTLRLIHPNCISYAHDVSGQVAETANTGIVAIGSRGLSGGMILDMGADTVKWLFPRDGFKDEDGGYTPWDYAPSLGHDFRLVTEKITTNSFILSQYNNGGNNDPFAGEAIEFEFNIGAPNPDMKPYTYGKLWGFSNFEVKSNALGSNRTLDNGTQLVNFGRMNNEDPLDPYWKIQWLDRMNPNIWRARIKFDEFGGETFNVNPIQNGEMGFFESLRPEVWVEDGFLYADTGYAEYLWMDGRMTTDNFIELPSTDPAELGVAVRVGYDNGWVASEALDSSEVVTSIVEFQEREISIFPNLTAAGKNVTVRGLPSMQTTAVLHSIDGSVAREVPVADERMKVPDLPKGIYLLTFPSDLPSVYARIIIQ